MSGPRDAGGDAAPDHGPNEYADALPEELDAAGYVGPYLFPDNARRRISAALYAVAGAGCLVAWFVSGASSGVFVNRGLPVAGAGFLAVAAYQAVAGYRLVVEDLEALAAASRAAGFAVGHASAQLGWRGLRSRPTWRILLYSAEDPPATRGLVLVDGVDGHVVEHFVEANPEDWSSYGASGALGSTDPEAL